MINDNLPFCACGCNERVKRFGRKFLNGHAGNKKLPREIRICKNLSCSNTFQCSVNDPRGYCSVSCGTKSRVVWNKGKKGLQRARNKGLTKETDSRVAKHANNNKGKHFYTQEMIRSSCKMKLDSWQNPEWREKQLKAILKGCGIKPTKPEILLNSILQQLFPNQYKYVGDGQVIIGGKCPDFININGQKKIIELFGDYWHSKKITGRTKLKEERQRIKHFSRYGYQTLIIWESELKDIDRLIKRIIKFNKR
jgi:G:T-mismatch repair DNA endonuclease (very short patch repair protein)